jgi:phenylacetate-coenzyme A ligase PaaK-like adenylate-forming protein
MPIVNAAMTFSDLIKSQLHRHAEPVRGAVDPAPIAADPALIAIDSTLIAVDSAPIAMIDQWIHRKIGQADNEALTRDALGTYQLAALRHTLAHAKENSSYYARALAGFDPVRDIESVRDIAKLPMMGEVDLTEYGSGLVCVPASGVSRIVTLPTSGTTGEPKRVYFTEADQELMIDYIANGLKVMTKPGDVWLILMPVERPGSVGDLVKIGLERIGCEVIAHGILPADGSGDKEAIALIAERGVNAMLATASAAVRLVGTSVAGRLAEGNAAERLAGMSATGCFAEERAAVRLAEASAADDAVRKSMTSILLSAEYVSDEAARRIESAWDCTVFEHYGMTEMGLGGAMACDARIGYHPREADLLFEIVDPDTGEPVPDGEYGEIVFTTLTREAMPLIRYRTGDYSRFIPGPCPCGSILKRIDRVADRKAVKGY